MDLTAKKHVGIIPPRQTKNKVYLDDFKNVITGSWNLVPNVLFYHLTYKRLLEVFSTGATYDVVIAARMRDDAAPEENNIFKALTKARLDMGLKTVFLISYNTFMAKMSGMDANAEQALIDEIFKRQYEVADPPLGGVVQTTSTEPVFLLSVVADIIEGPNRYLGRSTIHTIENQSHFLNHPPGETMVGIRQ